MSDGAGREQRRQRREKVVLRLPAAVGMCWRCRDEALSRAAPALGESQWNLNLSRRFLERVRLPISLAVGRRLSHGTAHSFEGSRTVFESGRRTPYLPTVPKFEGSCKTRVNGTASYMHLIDDRSEAKGAYHLDHLRGSSIAGTALQPEGNCSGLVFTDAKDWDSYLKIPSILPRDYVLRIYSGRRNSLRTLRHDARPECARLLLEPARFPLRTAVNSYSRVETGLGRSSSSAMGRRESAATELLGCSSPSRSSVLCHLAQRESPSPLSPRECHEKRESLVVNQHRTRAVRKQHLPPSDSSTAARPQ